MKTYLPPFLLLLLSLFLVSPISAEERGKVTVMGLGDSITEGGAYFTSYLYPLWEMLRNEGVDFEMVGPNTCKDGWGKIRCCGFSGMAVEFLDQHIEFYYKEHPADFVLLHAGHNHFIEEQPVPGMIAAYSSIIDKILKINPEAHILVAKVVHSGKLPKYGYIPQLNKEIARLAKTKDPDRVHLVNLPRSFNWRKHTVKDKVHPNTVGATVIADEWMKVLRTLLPD